MQVAGMRKFRTAAVGEWLKATATIASVLAAVGLLAACSSSNGGVGGKFFGSKNLGQDKPDDIPADYFTRRTFCPPIRIKGGTQALTVYERGHEAEPSAVRYQASIVKTARECANTADGIAIKVGVAGRAVAGPKGGPGNLTLPVRVVVLKQSGGVLYSELFKFGTTLSPPELGVDFSEVIPQFTVPAGPEDRDLIIYVGFDEGKTG
jgi:hypothetical protein